MHSEHDTQERSDLEAEAIQERRRRSGEDVPQSPREIAFVWIDLIEAIASESGVSSKPMVVSALADLAGEFPQLKSALRQQNQEMNDAIERRKTLRNRRG